MSNDDAPENVHSDPSPAAPNEERGDADYPQSEEAGHLPDPAMLLSFAAMQMDTKALLQTLLPILDGHAWIRLGMVADPTLGEIKRDLPAAQIAIDCIHFLLTKVESDMLAAERQEAHRRLNDLRMNYLARMREAESDR